jgi:hypothetical protein
MQDPRIQCRYNCAKEYISDERMSGKGHADGFLLKCMNRCSILASIQEGRNPSKSLQCQFDCAEALDESWKRTNYTNDQLPWDQRNKELLKCKTICPD